MPRNTGRFICYYRVSTIRQGRSGLGLEAQRDAVRSYLNGGDWQVAGEFTEIESGRRADRPELAKAFAACRLHRATLVIAKLDRLARNAAFLLGLRDSGIDFVAADMPNANRLTVGIMAMVAEDEAQRRVVNDRLRGGASPRGGLRRRSETAQDDEGDGGRRQEVAHPHDHCPFVRSGRAGGPTENGRSRSSSSRPP